MNFSVNHQWLAELENEDLGELDYIDPLSMEQLAESLASELWDQPPTQELHQVQSDQRQQQTYPNPTGLSFLGDDISKSYAAEGSPSSAIGAGVESMFSFTGGKSKELSFSSAASGGFGTPSPSPPPPTTTTMETKGRRRASSSAHEHEHVIAERKRREKMHLQFVTLASIIPDITKTDKVSLLGSTIEYVQQLRGRLKSLQEEHCHQSSGVGSTAESSPPLDARCCIGSEDGDGASPKIEADVRGTTVLLRVVCRDKKGVLIMVLKELEKHGLSIVNTNVLPLPGSSLNITVTAQVEDASSTAVELVNNLNSALKSF